MLILSIRVAAVKANSGRLVVYRWFAVLKGHGVRDMSDPYWVEFLHLGQRTIYMILALLLMWHRLRLECVCRVAGRGSKVIFLLKWLIVRNHRVVYKN